METTPTQAPRGREKRRGQLRGKRPRRPPVLAAIDLGTNNCRLLIAKPAANGGFSVVDSFSRIVRLGEGLGQTGVLNDSAIERTIAALKICAARVRASRATHVRAIATEACRRAANADQLISRVRDETGLPLTIVPSEEEARLAALGCAPLIGEAYQGAIVFDIGGGSTEIIWMRRGSHGAETIFAHSVPVGVVALAEEEGRRSDRAGYAAMLKDMISRISFVREEMDAKREFSLAAHHLLGTSGTVTTLAGVALGLTRYERARVDASWHKCDNILRVVERLVGLDVNGRRAVGCVGLDRAELIIAGCAIFAAIHALWPCTELRVADRGLREGMLRELLAEATR